MNCRKMEERIYLYEELTLSEKKIINDHILQCEACGELAERIFHSRAMIKGARNYTPGPDHPQVLTQRIMKAIEKEKSTSFLDGLVNYLNGYFLRYAITATSVFLVTFFIYEHQITDYPPSVSPISQAEITRGTVLDMGQFMNMYVKRRADKQTNSLSSRYTYYKSGRAGKKI